MTRRPAAPPRILLTGASGQIGAAVAAAAPAAWRIDRPARADLDLSAPEAIGAFLRDRDYDLILNAGAYTAVDKAESERAAVWRVNAEAPAALASAARLADTPVIHLSTDYVFDGAKGAPYVEDDPIGPINVYGAAKAAGELAVRAASPRNVVLRTAWVFSPRGTNFVKTMLRLARERAEIGVVSDQIGSPTGADDVALALVRVCGRLLDEKAEGGVYHFVNSGEASWFEVAEAVLATLRARGGPTPRLKAITTADYPTPARRPANSRLATGRFQATFDLQSRDWRQALEAVCAQLLPL